MKKTLKSILAITLALIMSFGTLTAFAAEGDTLEWVFEYDDETLEFEYFGEITEGTTVISTQTETYRRYYTFDAKEGYYLFTKGDYSQESYIDWVFTPDEMKNGTAYNTANSVIDWWEQIEDSEREEGNTIYKFEAGKAVIGLFVTAVPGTEAPELKIKYLGKDITDFDIATKEFVLGYDLYRGDSEGWLNTGVSLVFDGTKTINVKDSGLDYTSEIIKDGENVLTFELGDITKDITITAYPVEHYIKDAELSNADYYAQEFIDYDYDYWHYSVDGEAVTVTFTDLKEKDVIIKDNWGTVKFPNGNEYPIEIYYDYNNDDNRVLFITIAYKEVKEYECTVTKYGIIENGEILVENNHSEIGDFLNSIYWELDDATYYNTIFEIFESLFGSFFDTLINASDLFGGIFENIVSFIKFYLVG